MSNLDDDKQDDAFLFEIIIIIILCLVVAWIGIGRFTNEAFNCGAIGEHLKVEHQYDLLTGCKLNYENETDNEQD